MNRFAVRRDRWMIMLAAVLAVGLLAPAAAGAATRPEVRTTAASNVAQDTATVGGTVNPNDAATTYFFQYGTTRLYGGFTPESPAGAGKKRVAVTASLGGLAPATRYHYRLVARNAKGRVFGGDRTFRTRPQPLGVTLAATPNPVGYGKATVLGGNLTGTGNAGRQVVLQMNPFPYIQGFQNLGNPQVTDAAGAFSFPILSATLSAQFRVLMPQKPEVTSPIVALGVAVRVTTSVSRHRVVRGQRVRFAGRVRPARDRTVIAIQRFRKGQWRTIGTTIARHRNATSSRYSKRVRIRRSGRYRVFAGAEGQYVSNVGKTVRIRARRG